MDKLYRNWIQRGIVYGSAYGVLWAAFYFAGLEGAYAWAAFIVLLLHKMFLKNIV